jgi:choline dehydrogenase-like flavoprotein
MRLTGEQQQTLRAAVDRIIPPDDYPGAWQSGVGDYLARQFEGNLHPVLDDYCAGTCLMGHDPKTSVTDKWGRVHNHDNLFVIDGSLHVTNGGFNPVLTIMALAFRSAAYIARAYF